MEVDFIGEIDFLFTALAAVFASTAGVVEVAAVEGGKGSNQSILVVAPVVDVLR